MITAGIDCGAKNTKTVIMKDGEIIGKGRALTGFDLSKAITDSWEAALKDSSIKAGEVRKIFGTGSGKEAIKNIDSRVNDIKAMARAANFYFPNVRTIADVGAEEGRAAKIDEHGNSLDFAINDKCAAGSGAFIEAMGRALEIPLEEMGFLALASDKEIPMNAQCAIFAESEVVGLIHAMTEKRDICKAIHDAMASRIVSMIKRIGINPEVVLTGGVALNPGFVASMKKQMKIDLIQVPDNPEYAMAVGAAVAAAE